ncbi:MAG: thiamine-phosphate kinase [Geminicoccaceae bacterium]|nr:MAG: thiamine-phosphate kinase [Geminicoccaceae bacterium]
MSTRRGEFELIGELFAPLATDPAALGLRDDAAVLPATTDELVVAKDALVQGVHFLATDPPASVAQKALRVNLSDLAAMGARPVGYLLALVRPPGIDDAWLEGFAAGLAADQARFGLTLLGGDTVKTPGPLVVSLTILGRVAPGTALRRAGARPGDDVWVSGTLGDAALGLHVLQGGWAPADEEAMAYLVERYRRPEPRLALGQALHGLASACQDVSDGLVQDLGHIAWNSGVAIRVEAPALPSSPAAADAPDALIQALSGGDDYELVFTAPKDARFRLQALSSEVPLTRIGRVEPGEGVTVFDADGQPMTLTKRGWSHGWT